MSTKAGEQEINFNNFNTASKYGYAILIGSCFLFVFGIIISLGIWRWVFSGSDLLQQVSFFNNIDFNGTGLSPIEYYFSLSILLVVILWVWCIVSWVGMKLFQHAKGGV